MKLSYYNKREELTEEEKICEHVAQTIYYNQYSDKAV